MLQAVATLISLIVGAIAVGVIVQVLAEEWESARIALRLAQPAETLLPLPPRFRVTGARRGTTVRLAPPARIRAAL